MKILSLILILFLSGCAHWDTTDKLLYSGLVGAVVADIATTNKCIDNGGHENNPIFKDNQDLIIPINIAVLFGAYLISDHLPSKERKWFLGIANGLRWGVAIHNYGEIN